MTYEPGTRFAYSGSGYTLLQLPIEEVSDSDFETYMQQTIFEPLEMTDTTFDWQRASSGGLADSYDTDGSTAPYRRYTALAAASLYSTLRDMARFTQAHYSGDGSEVAGRGVLTPETLELMRQPSAMQAYGLGCALYASDNAGGFVFGHDGGNAPAIHAAVRVNAGTGSGIVAFSTGDIEGLAPQLAAEWVFWETVTSTPLWPWSDGGHRCIPSLQVEQRLSCSHVRWVGSADRGEADGSVPLGYRAPITALASGPTGCWEECGRLVAKGCLNARRAVPRPNIASVYTAAFFGINGLD